MPTELLLIRHGESEANIGRSTDPDCTITDNGLDQARRLGAQLSAIDLSGFEGVTSPYQRATRTAAEVGRATRLDFTVDEHIREWGDVATINGREFPRETVEELIARLTQFLRRIEGRRMVIVSHAAPIAVLTQLAWGESPNTQGQFWAGVGNCRPRWLTTLLRFG